MLAGRTLRRMLVVGLAAATIATLPDSPAEACEADFWIDPDTGRLVLDACEGSNDGGARTCHRWDGARVPCYLDGYGWWDGEDCYITPAVPQPGAGSPVWEGNTPDDGLIYDVVCTGLDGVDGLTMFEFPFQRFYALGEGLLGDLIDQAIGMLELAGPEMGIAPDPDGAGLIGLPVWMWTEVTPTTWEPDPVSLTALGVTVTVEAAVDHVEWNMGDGGVVTCDQPGTPYQREFGLARSPDCGYHPGYRQPSRSEPDGRYTVTATTHWVITWEFVGTSVAGTVETTRESSASVRINELQVLVGFE